MNYREILMKLIGAIDPAGDSAIDEKRFDNLKELTCLVEELILDIQYVARQADREEFSVSRAGKLARKCLADIKDIIEDGTQT